MDSREFLVGSRRVRRFVPRGSVRELRVRGGLIRRPEGPESGHPRADCVTFRRGVGPRAVRRLRLALTCLRFGLELGLWHSSAALHGADVERRAFPGERFAERGLHNAERFEESVLPAAGSAASRPGFQGRRRAGARSIVQRSERSRERAAPRGVFHEGGFRRFLRPLFADGRRRKIFRQNLLCLCRFAASAECSAVFCSEQCSAFSAPPAEPSGRSRQSRLSNRNLKKG